MRRTFLFFFAIAIAITVTTAGTAPAGTILQFFQVNLADQITATDVSGVTSLSTGGNLDGNGVSIPVFLTGPTIAPGTGGYETFFGVHSTGPATLVGGVINQPYSGTIAFTSGVDGTGINYLTATFANAVTAGVSGANNGTAGSLSATQPPDTLVLTSDVLGTLVAPTAMGIGLSNVQPFLSIAPDGSIDNFVAQNAGTFSATISGGGHIPEPSSVVLAGIGMVVALFAHYCRRR